MMKDISPLCPNCDNEGSQNFEYIEENLNEGLRAPADDPGSVCDNCLYFKDESYIPICNNCKNGEWKQTAPKI